jgi:hypothetical protein
MALTNSAEIEAFADALTDCANAIHSQLIDGIKKEELTTEEARLIFQHEGSLRQFANGLYLNAVVRIVKNLEEPQQDILDLVESAKEEMKKIKKAASFIDLVADLLVLAAAVSAGKPKPVLSALKEIRSDIKELR